MCLTAAIAMAACTQDVTAPSAARPRPGGAAHRDVLTSVTPLVSAGFNTSCVLRTTGVVNCFGVNDLGQAPSVKNPAPGGMFTRLSESTEASFGCALRNDGVIQCWGDNGSGQAPDSVYDRAYDDVGVGDSHACGLGGDGIIYCWGDDTNGRAPASLAASSGTFTAFAVGSYAGCGVRSDGVLECWGDLSTSGFPSTLTPATGSFTQVAVGYNHGCALRDDGSVECFGMNDLGQSPALKSAASSYFTHVSAGDDQSCASRADGVVECWGGNDHAQGPATQTSAYGSFISVSAGTNHSCGVRPTGRIECWGGEAFGTTDSTEIVNEVPAVAVAAVSGTEIALTWDAPAGATAIRVQRRVRNTNGTYSGYDVIATPSVSASTYTDASAISGTTYQYRIIKYDGTTWSQWGNPSAAILAKAPSPPGSLTGITASVPARTVIDVAWTDTTTESGFELQRRDVTSSPWGPWVLVAVTAAGDTDYADSSVTPASRYQYRARACSAAGCSASWSQTASVWAETKPGQPTVSVSVTSYTQIDVTWSDTSTNVVAYRVDRREWDDGTSTWGSWSPLHAEAAAGSYSDATVSADRRFQYRVVACNHAGCTGRTPPWVATAAVPAASSTMTAVWDAGVMDLMWGNDATNETRFEVQRSHRTSPGVWEAYGTVATTFADTTSFGDDYDIAHGETYKYRVRACNIGGCSAWKYSGSVTVPALL